MVHSQEILYPVYEHLIKKYDLLMQERSHRGVVLGEVSGLGELLIEKDSWEDYTEQWLLKLNQR